MHLRRPRQSLPPSRYHSFSLRRPPKNNLYVIRQGTEEHGTRSAAFIWSKGIHTARNSSCTDLQPIFDGKLPALLCSIERRISATCSVMQARREASLPRKLYNCFYLPHFFLSPNLIEIFRIVSYHALTFKTPVFPRERFGGRKVEHSRKGAIPYAYFSFFTGQFSLALARKAVCIHSYKLSRCGLARAGQS